MKRLILICGAILAVPLSSMAQTASDPNSGSRLTYDSFNAFYTLSWWAISGKSYFIQHSEDLITWYYYPAVATANTTGVAGVNVQTNATRFFLRLEIETDPYNTDSDGDGMSDGYEVLNGLNPHLADGLLDLDGDGIPNREDARPNDPTVGRLSIVITTPGNNTILP